MEKKWGIQSLAFSGHSRLSTSMLVCLTVTDVGIAKGSLAELVRRHVTFDIPDRGRTHAIQFLVSSAGLRILAGNRECEQGLSREFLQGITAPHRQFILGDQERNDPQGWVWSDRECHVVLMIYASDDTSLDVFVQDISRQVAEGCRITYTLRLRLDEHEPFGFRDGISNPTLKMNRHDQILDHADIIPDGDVILGFRDSSGAVNDVPKMGRLGSYVVVRQLAQDVKAFWEFWRSHARNDAEAVWLASKAVGRWPNGMPLQSQTEFRQPEYDPVVVRRPLSFQLDLFGDICPPGSHIRRSHPRDGLSEDFQESLTISAAHRIVRRGRVYGPAVPSEWLPEDTLRTHEVYPRQEASDERGILFLGLCTDIARQFEFIQQTWLNNPKHVSPVGEVDPIAAGASASCGFTIPRLPLSRCIAGLKSFVTVRAGGYFLMPCQSAFDNLFSDLRVGE